MNKTIQAMMKAAGVNSPDELFEMYPTEAAFIAAHPDVAKKYKMGGTPEAFNMSMPADKFFSYGVPVPPTYHKEGGSLTNRMVYPQIQSADQFFSPVYSNSNNAYAEGGNIEAFPQAVSYPQAGWGKTNYFMLGEGGTFPPGMPQYTGMLPVMEMGAPTTGIMTRTIEDNNHYGVRPMQDGGQSGMASDNAALSKLQKFISNIQELGQKNLPEQIVEPGARYGGQPLKKYEGDRDSSQVAGLGILQPDIYADAQIEARLNNAQSQNTAQETSQEANRAAVNTQAAEDQMLITARQMGHNSVAEYEKSNWGYGPNHPNYKKPGTSPKSKPAPNKTAPKGNAPAAAPAAPVNPPVASQNNSVAGNTTGTTAGTTGTNTNPGTTTGTTGTAGTTGLPSGWIKSTDPWGREGYYNPAEDNRFYVPANMQGYQRGNYDPYYDNYGYPDDYGYGYSNPWIIPGGYTNPRFITRQDRRIFDDAVARGLLTPEHLSQSGIKAKTVYKTNTLFPWNKNKKIAYREFTIPGITPGTAPGSNQTGVAQAPTSGRTTTVPEIQDPGPRPSTSWAGQTQARPMLTPDMMQAMNQGARTQAAPLDIDAVGPVNRGPVLSPDVYDGMTVGSGVPVTPVPMSNPSYNPQFDEARMLGQISSNEANYFATEPSNILDKDWRTQKVTGDSGLYAGQRGVDAWNNKVMNDPNKKQIWDSYSDVPAPLKDIAGDHLFNASSDPRIFTLAAAGAIDMKDSLKYKNDPKLLEDTWNQNKGLIQQQYNDDPQAFTSAVSDHRNILYSKARTKTGDIPSNSGTPGLQYNAWSGRTGATQDYIDQAYFGPGTGYVAPQFFQRYGGPFALPMYVTGGPGSILEDENPFGGTELMTQANPEQNMYWNTGTLEQTNKVARELEKNNPLGKIYTKGLEQEEDTKFRTKDPKKKRNRTSADADLFFMNVLAKFFNKLQDKGPSYTSAADNFNTVASTDGSYLTNVSGVGNSFRPNDYVWNKKGFSAPDSVLPMTQTGGQQFANMDGDQYYLTQEQINKVIKAGGRVPGF